MGYERAEWMRGNFGVMSHWLFQPVGAAPVIGTVEDNVKEWNERVNGFNVDALAEQLACTNAKWFILTIGQNSGYYLAPNSVYDKLTEAALSKCSERDLFKDLAVALKKKGIKTMAYIPSGAPDKDFDACMKLKWQDGYYRDENGRPVTMPDGVRCRRPNHRLAEFQTMWEAVIKQWSDSWGELCAGWWVDGVYFADQMYNYETEPNFKSLANALRSGNPQSAICFNNGIMRADLIDPTSAEEDYSSGEANSYLYIPFGRAKVRDDMKEGYIGQSQFHVLNFLGRNWGHGETPRLPEDLSVAWSNYILSNKGALTWDVPTNNIGEIPQIYIDILSKIVLL